LGRYRTEEGTISLQSAKNHRDLDLRRKEIS